jgi:hypothetical protein
MRSLLRPMVGGLLRPSSRAFLSTSVSPTIPTPLKCTKNRVRYRTSDEEKRKELMDKILAYNKEDLEATWAVFEWLRGKSNVSSSYLGAQLPK